jgi:hypothetical protein
MKRKFLIGQHHPISAKRKIVRALLFPVRDSNQGNLFAHGDSISPTNFPKQLAETASK